ncbi:hypothetical protein [Sulfuracidifex tepidarius]|uniref:Uncharacterized protein n=1 Tax=Sulfuracidifex tepidarius TaxID=1294262 RepID=A0A510E1P7_9CREN|nr:hypothetical protein [Sulfuracidifex tepidarius]BBG26416.1 hypothetical protein IC007_0924 [Sulfuracidifex tepidarius]
MSHKGMLWGKKGLSYVLLAMTVAASFLGVVYFLFSPILVDFYHTDNGEVEYFLNRMGDPSFLVKTYVSGTQEPTIVSVFVNLPNKVVELETRRTDELTIPFSEVSPYIKAWEGKEGNTSLLVIASYVKSGHMYYSAEEVDYNPRWVFHGYPIQVVSTINVVPKEINVDYSYLHSIEEGIERKVDATPRIYCPGYGGGSGKLDNYVINVTPFNGSAPCYDDGYPPSDYRPSYKGIVIHDLEVPMSWLTISNNVAHRDDYSSIYLSSALTGKVGWEAVSNSSNYGGPYIGTSYSANVNWFGFSSYYYSFLHKLFSPTMYTYYNATVAVVQYCVSTIACPVVSSKAHQAGSFLNVPEANVTVTEVLYANPSYRDVGGAVEETTSFTCVEYHTPEGTDKSFIDGNGTPTMLYQVEGTHVSFSHYGEVRWKDGDINYESSRIFARSGNTWATYTTSTYVHVNNPYEIPTDILAAATTIAISLSTFGLAGLVEGLISTAIIDAISIQLPNNVQYYNANDQLVMSVNGTGHVYLSYENYSTVKHVPSFGFVMNYTSYYGE